MNTKRKSIPLDKKQIIEKRAPEKPHFLNDSSPPSMKEHLQEQLVEKYNTCCLCGTTLEFTHVTHFVNDIVIEETNCPRCMVKTKKQTHILQ